MFISTQPHYIFFLNPEKLEQTRHSISSTYDSSGGLEMPSHTIITVNLAKGKKIAGSPIETPTEIMTIVSGCPMERASAEAFARLILWMEADYGWDRWRAYDILTHVARTSMGYYGLGTMAAKIEKRYLAKPA
ncbi:MAG: hypothetical protein ACKVP0_15185 [Pirellulaceae bacterium]